MHCMKCGRKIENNGVFCDECLGVMEKYPVKQNAPLQLSRAKIETDIRRPAKTKLQAAPEEQVRGLRRQMRRLRLLVVILLLVVSLLTAALAYLVFFQPDAAEKDWGKNYTTSESDG